MKKVSVIAFLALLCLAALPSTAQVNPVWTAVASTGAIDEASAGIYAVGPTQLGYLPASASLNTIVSRYNVTNLAGFQNPPWTTLELGYFDNAVGSQVSATLWQVRPCNGAQAALCTVTSVDSNTATCNKCSLPTGAAFDFNQFLYYVEVRVSRSTAALQPLAYTLRIF